MRLHKTHVFCGPSISRKIVEKSFPGAETHAPIAGGDLKALVRGSSPGNVLIIDGMFFQKESVSLTEIKEAIEKGWRIFGSSSMGALRAVEASPLGMIGIGRIYRWLKLFRVEDDDEVAQLVNPSSFNAESLAMVDIRHYIASLVRSKLISTADGRSILGEMKNQYFPYRTKELLRKKLADAGYRGTDPWVPLKKLDAMQALSTLARFS